MEEYNWEIEFKDEDYSTPHSIVNGKEDWGKARWIETHQLLLKGNELLFFLLEVLETPHKGTINEGYKFLIGFKKLENMTSIYELINQTEHVLFKDGKEKGVIFYLYFAHLDDAISVLNEIKNQKIIQTLETLPA